MAKNNDKPNIEDEINDLLGKLDNFPQEQSESPSHKKFRELSNNRRRNCSALLLS